MSEVFKENLRARLQINRAVLIGFLAAFGECDTRKMREMEAELYKRVYDGLGPLPKFTRERLESLPQEVWGEATPVAWSASFLVLEHLAEPVEDKADTPIHCVRVVNAAGEVDPALTVVAQLAITLMFDLMKTEMFGVMAARR